MNRWLADLLACPRHHTSLSATSLDLRCEHGCLFPVVDDVPVMLLEESRQTIDVANHSLRLARQPDDDGGFYVEAVGLSDQEKRGIRELLAAGQTEIDPVISYLIGATNGIAYLHQVGSLREYPIPTLRLPAATGQILLDLGCNWGRWSMAAARKGFRPIGIDPSLGAVMAARRLARRLGLEAEFLVGDARFLPFRSAVIDQVFSYSVLQHFSRADVGLVAAEVGRVIKPGGASLIQMPSVAGVRCLYHQARRGFRDGTGFDVRYWTLPALRKLFSEQVGVTEFSTDCYFGIGLQFSDVKYMTPVVKAVVVASEGLRHLSRVVPPLVWLADSVYVSSRKERN